MSDSEALAKPAAPEPLKDFRKLNDQIYVRDGKPGTSNSTDPEVIIIFAWGDSRPKHIAKFVDGYLKLFPSSKIVVVLGPIVQALSEGLEKRSRRMKPVIEEVFGAHKGEVDDSPAPRRNLIHVMSNTGGINYAAAMHAYTQMMSSPESGEAKQMPTSYIVYDSTPGGNHFFRNLKRWSWAMAIGTASFFPWPAVFTQALAAILIAGIYGSAWITGVPTAAEFSIGAAYDPELSDKSAPRLYIYSKSDSIISYEDIEEHAAVARQRGFEVEMEEFEGTDHVGHMRVYPERYWEVIRKGWEASRQDE